MVGLPVLLVGFALVEEAALHTGTLLLAGPLPPTGGFLPRQSDLLHLPPAQLFPQYVPIWLHQDWYLAHCRLAG